MSSAEEARIEEILRRRYPDSEYVWLTAEERYWVVSLLTYEIKRLRGSGRGTWGAKHARELRNLKRRMIPAVDSEKPCKSGDSGDGGN